VKGHPVGVVPGGSREAEMRVLSKCKDLWLWVAVVSPSTTETGASAQSVPPTLPRPAVPLPRWSEVAPEIADSAGAESAAARRRRHSTVA
jgi:hypothetical protein